MSINQPIPDLINILENIGIVIIEIDNPDERFSDFDGLSEVVNNIPLIVLLSDIDGERQRFTIAHELGHCCKHGQNLENNYIEMFCDNQDVNEAEEAEATLFASQLLIPEKQLKDLHSKLVQPSLQKLSELFEVPKDLMLKRIVDLKMAYYDDDKKEMIPPCL